MLESFLGQEARRETLGIFIPTIIKKEEEISQNLEKNML